MPTYRLTVGTAVSLAIAACIAATAPAIQGPARQPYQDPAPPPGHIVLVVEGNVGDLHVTHALAKVDKWAGVPKGATSEFAFVAFDRSGREIARVPIDLSQFDTDPTHIGRPDVVTGCEVRSTRIGVLLNVPDVTGAAACEFVRGNTVIGRLGAADLQALLRSPR